MGEMQTSMWSSYAKSSPVWQHKKLMSISIPDRDETSVYALDLASTMARYINFELLKVKMKSSTAKESWSQLAPIVSFSLALRELAVISQRQCVVNSINAQYLANEIDGLVTGLGGIIVRDVPGSSNHDSEVLAKVCRIIESIVENAGGSFGRKMKNPLARMIAVQAEVQGGFAAVLRLWPFVSTADTSEIIRPLLDTDRT